MAWSGRFTSTTSDASRAPSLPGRCASSRDERAPRAETLRYGDNPAHGIVGCLGDVPLASVTVSVRPKVSDPQAVWAAPR